MAEQKTYSIKIDGIEQSVKGVESLGTNLTKTDNAFKETQKSLKAVKAEMASLEKYSDEWNALAKVAGDYKDKLDDINQAIRRNASDTKALDDAINIGQSMVSTFTLAKGAMSAFGLETDDAVKAIQKLQGAMAIIQSLQTLQNTLRGSTATADLLTKSYKALTLSMEGATTATKAFKVALASIGIGLVIIAITELVSHWDDLTEAIGLSNKKLEESNQLFDEGIGAYAKGKAELQAYISKLENFNGTKDQEKQLVEECNKKYGEAFGHYDTLAQCKDILIQKTEAYCKTLMLEAQMQAKVNQLAAAYEKVAKAKKEWNRVKKGDLTYWEQVKDFFSPGSTFDNAKNEFNDARNAADKLDAEIEELAKTIAEHNLENGLFQGGGGKTKPTKAAKEQVDQLKKIYADYIKAAMKSEKELADYKKQLDEETKKSKEKALKAQEKLSKAEYDRQIAILDSEIQLANQIKDEAKRQERIKKLEEKKLELAREREKQENRIAAADALGIQVSELDDMIAKYKDLNEEQKAILDTLQAQNETVDIKIQTSLDKLNSGGGKKGDKEGNAFGEWFNSEMTQASIDIAQEAFDTIAEGFLQMMDYEVECAQEALDEITEMHDEQVDKVQDSQDRISELNDKLKDSSGAQLEAYKQQMVDETLLLQQREQEERRIQKEKEKREKELEKQEKKRKKAEAATQIVQASIEIAMAVLKAMSSFPPPASFIMAGLTSAFGLVQLAMMTKAYSKLADGGLLSGKSHAQGGIPVGNTGIEVEGGEYVVNKRSTAKYLPLLQQINEEGARRKTVANQLGKMADGGQLNYERINSNMDAMNTAKIVSTAIEGIDFHPVVSVVDINRGQKNMTEVRQLAGANG